MFVLGLETATPHGSVAIVGPPGLLAKSTALVPMRHLEWLVPTVERVLADAGITRGQIEGLAVSQGPGGVTGLRIGIATAAARARATRLPGLRLSPPQAPAATH